jgi:hypothetical protein
MVAASHPYTLAIENGSQLTWTFKNILLPDSNINEPASHGYIVYRIRPKTDVMAGETIHNTASIYFDYNLPVLTNDASTLVRANLVTLPQGLLNFQGNLLGERTNLSWKMATIGTILRFEIERSTDGRNYQPIGTRTTSGTATGFLFSDDLLTVQNLLIYYRLKIVESDGSYHFSNVLVFKRNSGKTKTLEVYPNPVSGEAFVSFTGSLAGTAEVQLLNTSGIVIKKERVVVQKGTNVFPITRTDAITPGIYTVRIITSGGNMESVLIMVQ